MAWTTYQKFLAVLMAATGSINTLSTKWADTMESKGSDGDVRKFVHPFMQALAMFIGETLCLLTFKALQRWHRGNSDHPLVAGRQDFNPLILMPAAMFDLVGTSIMYVGLNLTYPSSFQMFRGAVILFVALLSATVLGRYISRMEFVGIANVILGLVVVGVTDAVFQSGDGRGPNSLITGDLLILVAQVAAACQMVYEEKYVAGLNIPALQAVGWEGVFGVAALAVLLPVLQWVPAPPPFGTGAHSTVEDVIDAFVQMGNNPLLPVAVCGMVVSIAFFNFAGISVTKQMSATTRMVLDSFRTLVVWAVSIGVAWQAFHWPHLVGFGILMLGLCGYNGLLPRMPCGREQSPAVDEEPLEEEAY